MVQWYKEWVKALREGNMICKRRQLYLSASTNVGKSTAIEDIIGKVNMKFVFNPGVGKYFMQGFDEYYHKYISFEDFKIEFHPLNMLKRLLEGRKYACPVKCMPDHVFKAERLNKVLIT